MQSNQVLFLRFFFPSAKENVSLDLQLPPHVPILKWRKECGDSILGDVLESSRTPHSRAWVPSECDDVISRAHVSTYIGQQATALNDR